MAKQTSIYKKPQVYKADTGNNGYDSIQVTNKKSTKIRGTGAATKGTTASSKMG